MGKKYIVELVERHKGYILNKDTIGIVSSIDQAHTISDTFFKDNADFVGKNRVTGVKSVVFIDHLDTYYPNNTSYAIKCTEIIWYG